MWPTSSSRRTSITLQNTQVFIARFMLYFFKEALWSRLKGWRRLPGVVLTPSCSIPFSLPYSSPVPFALENWCRSVGKHSFRSARCHRRRRRRRLGAATVRRKRKRETRDEEKEKERRCIHRQDTLLVGSIIVHVGDTAGSQFSCARTFLKKEKVPTVQHIRVPLFFGTPLFFPRARNTRVPPGEWFITGGGTREPLWCPSRFFLPSSRPPKLC